MAKKDFHQAWLYYSFARWPVPNSPGKQRAYEKALEAYARPRQELRSAAGGGARPLRGQRGRRLPADAEGRRASTPFIIAIAGLDSRKEEMVERFAPLVDARHRRARARLARHRAIRGEGRGRAPTRSLEPSARRRARASAASTRSASRSMAAATAATGRRSSQSPNNSACARSWRSRRRSTRRSFASAPAALAQTANTCSTTCRRSSFTYGATNMAAARRGARAHVAQDARPARAADGADAGDRRRARHAGADRRHRPPACAAATRRRILWVHPRGGHMGRDAQGLARPGDLQARDRAVAAAVPRSIQARLAARKTAWRLLDTGRRARTAPAAL